MVKKIDGEVYVVELYDNPTANDLYSKLPLTLTVNDYAGWDEKIIRLEEPLSMESAPMGDCPKIPEIDKCKSVYNYTRRR